MGNAWFGKKRSSKGSVVHPAVGDQAHQGSVTIKVRMTRGQLKDLMEKVDNMSEGKSELGRLIVHECSKGRLHARVANNAAAAAAAGDTSQKANNRYASGLRPIQEHGEE